MKNVKLNFLLILYLILSFPYQGNADCPQLVWTNTGAESGSKKALDGVVAIFTFGAKGSFKVDEKLYHYIRVNAIRDQGVEGYFNPKIQVCDYEGGNCYELYSGTSCRQIYGTQSTGAGVSAAVFIDWDGDRMLEDGQIRGGIAKGLGWEWANGVTTEEQEKFANSPKICACTQKGACMSGVSAYLARVDQGANIFYPGEMENVCDTCPWRSRGKQKIKCAPIQLAPGPPPFCKQLEMSPAQARIVPIADKDNDYFDSRVKVIVGNLQDGSIERRLDFPNQYGKDKAKEHSVSGEGGVTHYFKTYREKNKLYAEYHGTKGIDESKNLQFTRYFPAPHAPEPEVVKIVDSNTLQIKIKMNKYACRAYYGDPGNGSCTFNISKRGKQIGPFFFEVVKPKIVKQTPENKNRDEVLEKILGNDTQFKILDDYDCVPNIETECKEFDEKGKCKLDSLGQPEIEVKYTECELDAKGKCKLNSLGQPEIKDNSKSKMLCLSGWKPDPEEFLLKKEDEIISLKSIGTKYTGYNAVFSKESKKFHYFPSDEVVDILERRLQSELDEIVFNKQGYISIPKMNEGKSHCTVDKDKELLERQDWSRCKVVYELTDGEYKDPNPCNQDIDGCICPNGKCSRSTEYIKGDQPFYLRYEEVFYKDEDGKIQKGTQLKDQLTKVNRSEVFYANKLCKFDLSGLKEDLKRIIKTQLNSKKDALEKQRQKPYDLGDGYTDDLSRYDYVEIEAWGGGEAGHIRGQASSRETRSGMPGDYIKAKLKIDPNYPFIQVKVTEGGGSQESYESNKDGGPTIIKMCKNNTEQDCKDLMTVAGGGKYRTYGETEYKETKVHRNLKQGEAHEIKIAKVEHTKDRDKQVAYIENSQVKYKPMRCDNLDSNNVNSSGKHGAGGCIDQNGSGKNYGKGSPGYARIKPILGEINETKINDLIGRVVDGFESNIDIDDPLIKELDGKIVDTIQNKIKTELLGE